MYKKKELINLSYKLNIPAFNKLLNELQKDYDIWAPKRFRNKGNFADNDYIAYGEISSFDEIELEEKSTSSAKEVVFPITQTVLYFDETGHRVPQIPNRKKLVIARACDITGISRLDKLYYENGEPDFYYKRLRELVSFIILECPHDYGSCFCASMGGNVTDDYVMGMKVEEAHIHLDTKEGELEAYFQNIDKQAIQYSFHFVEENDIKVETPKTTQMPIGIFEHPMWKTYDRCINCGRCNLNCPTCTCFTTTDIFYNENKTLGERRRVWSTCHFPKYTLMAGGHSVRDHQRSRGRFHVLHKVYDYRKRFGSFNMCIGCGRCEDSCPKFISYIEAVRTLGKVLEEEYQYEK